jgi:two-component system chemotaxis response regulator CheB
MHGGDASGTSRARDAGAVGPVPRAARAPGVAPGTATPEEPGSIVVVGASAGGVDPLVALVSGLPADTRATLLIVLHVPESVESLLPRILAREAAVPVMHAHDGQALEAGAALVAPPGRHLLVEDGVARLWRGPKENGHRPAVDPLFRSAAAAYGSAVIGIVLSGARADGAAGLAAIKSRGGVTVVQADAVHLGMPTSALGRVDVDHVVAVGDMPALVARLTGAAPPAGEPRGGTVQEPHRTSGSTEAPTTRPA